MSQPLVFSISWNLEELGSNAIKGMDLLVRQEQASKEQERPSPMSLYRLLAGNTAQIRGRFPPPQKI